MANVRGGLSLGSASSFSGMGKIPLRALAAPILTPKTVTDPTKAGSASDKLGILTRAQWEDYKTRFQPYDKASINLATSDADNEAAVANAQAGVADSFGVAQGTLQRNNERLGLSSATDATLLNQRNSQAASTAAQVNVMNNTRLAAKDRDNSILSGNSAVGLSNSVFGG